MILLGKSQFKGKYLFIKENRQNKVLSNHKDIVFLYLELPIYIINPNNYSINKSEIRTCSYTERRSIRQKNILEESVALIIDSQKPLKVIVGDLTYVRVQQKAYLCSYWHV